MKRETMTVRIQKKLTHKDIILKKGYPLLGLLVAIGGAISLVYKMSINEWNLLFVIVISPCNLTSMVSGAGLLTYKYFKQVGGIILSVFTPLLLCLGFYAFIYVETFTDPVGHFGMILLALAIVAYHYLLEEPLLNIELTYVGIGLFMAWLLFVVPFNFQVETVWCENCR